MTAASTDATAEMKLFYRQGCPISSLGPAWYLHCTWYLHGPAGGSVVSVGMATLHHHGLRGQAATLGVCGYILQLGDAELQQHICHLREEAGYKAEGRQHARPIQIFPYGRRQRGGLGSLRNLAQIRARFPHLSNQDSTELAEVAARRWLTHPKHPIHGN